MQDLIDVTCTVNYPRLHSNSPATVYMTVEINSLKQPEDSSSRRKNFSLVVDRSSSMYGEKINQAKKAAISLFEEELEYNDYVSVISFDTSAKVVLASVNKSESETARNIIENLRLGRGTNIYEGLELAYKEISKEPKEQGSNMIRRISLITDGYPSVGTREEADFISLSKRIREDGMTIDTIGIGEQYNQHLLTEIAEAGGGVPYHISEAKADEIPETVSEEVDELSNTVVISPTFKITMMPGAEIRDIYTVTPTLRKQNVDRSNSNRYVARLKDIIVGQSQTLVLTLELPSRSAGTYRLARIEVGDNLVKNVEIVYTDDPVVEDLEPRMTYTCSKATVLANIGLQSGNTETIREAETLVKDLSQHKDFERVMARRPILKRMTLTITRILLRISQGPLTESEKREAIHDTTVIR